MKVSDFHYDLPAALIAQYPPEERRGSRLLQLSGEDDLVDCNFADFPGCLEAGDLMVLNDTRVVPARLLGRKETGGKVEILVERILEGNRLLAQVRASKALKPGQRLDIDGSGESGQLTVEDREGPFYILLSDAEESINLWLTRFGHVPLPPYIDRPDTPVDQERYQTVYAANPGAVAAPTAGLHLDVRMLKEIFEKGVQIEALTLHVGAGTFQPIRLEKLEDHTMHKERVEVSQSLCDAIATTRERGRRVVAVGTTVVRALESAVSDGKLRPFRGETNLFIYPGFRFHVVDALLTNFHLPGSTLLMLVSAFAGREAIMRAYKHAIKEQYRFFSYGDAMFMGCQAKAAGGAGP